MKFVDSCKVHLAAGKGGNGCVAFRREKFVAHGGPAGGDGGEGGNIVFVAAPGMSTLLDFTHARSIRAEDGEPGRGKDQYGRGGGDRELRVPVGTQILDDETGVLIGDIAEPDARMIVAKGGRGGRGNIHFASSFDRAPRRAEPGEPGEERHVRLELKVMADVGLLGFPNVGKSTFIRAVSAARPKVAEYPFTTLVPHLGVVRVDEDASFVMADIPGLIPGASSGAGLGIRFLKHVERTRALLHLLTVDPGEDRDPANDYDVLMKELEHFDPELAQRPMIVALSQTDRTDVREVFPAVQSAMQKRGIALRLVSAVTGEGVRELVRDLFRLIRGEPVDGVAVEEVDAKPKPKPKPKPKKAEAKKAVVKSAPSKTKRKAAKAKATKKSSPKRATKSTPRPKVENAKKQKQKQKPAKKKTAAATRTPVKKAKKKTASRKRRS